METSTNVTRMKRLIRQQTDLTAALTWISVVIHSTLDDLSSFLTRALAGGAQCFCSVPQHRTNLDQVGERLDGVRQKKKRKVLHATRICLSVLNGCSAAMLMRSVRVNSDRRVC